MAKILLVEDEETLLDMMKERFLSEGYEVLTAVDGEDAILKARTKQPDLIVLDVMLPKIDGFEVCAILKHDDRYQQIPIIMLTARVGAEDKKIGMRDSHANAYLEKPFDSQILLAEVKKQLEKEKRNG